MIHCFQISFIRSFSQFFFLLKGRRKRKSDKLLLWVRKAANSWKNVSLGTHLDIWSPIFGYRPPPFSIYNDTSELIAKGPRLARCSIVDSEHWWHFFFFWFECFYSLFITVTWTISMIRDLFNSPSFKCPRIICRNFRQSLVTAPTQIRFQWYHNDSTSFWNFAKDDSQTGVSHFRPWHIN